MPDKYVHRSSDLGFVVVMALHLSGWGGIRTPGTVSRTAVFKTAALDHSATHPLIVDTRGARSGSRGTLAFRDEACQTRSPCDNQFLERHARDRDMGRAFGPSSRSRRTIPGPLAQAGIPRAFGPDNRLLVTSSTP